MTSPFNLTGQVALVTGANTGLGQAIAVGLAEAGADIVAVGRTLPDETAALVAKAGRRLHAVSADLSTTQPIERVVFEAYAATGRLDILVNNAGIQFVSPVEEFPDAKWDAIIAINMSSNFHAIKAALPGMKARNWGRIINIASAHGLRGSPEKVAYVTAKHGVVGMTKVVAQEVAKTPITVNAICPGFVRTPLAEAQIGPLAKQHGVSEEVALTDYLLEKQPSKRWVEVEEVARMALYLCGPGSGGVTGTALSIDGGWTSA